MFMGFIINIVNNKGGCGKTTTACNLADALGKKGKHILVIDMDSQCNTTSLLLPKNVPLRNNLYDLLDPNKDRKDLKDFFYPTNCKNVILIPNISETANLEPQLILKAPESFFKLRNTLRQYAVENYDFTIIDNPPNMGTFVLCSLYASDFVIVPIKAGSAFSVEGLFKATQLINDVRGRGNNDLRFLRLLINGKDKRTAISKALIDQVHSTFNNDQIFKTEIPVNTTFEKAESSGNTIFQYDAAASGAKAFRELAKELIDILKG
jgi:cellulose biosynthesis protein BcsQ